jgi:hypothetical protein
MLALRAFTKCFSASSALLVGLMLSGAAQAVPVVTYTFDFTGAPVNTPTITAGNAWEFVDPADNTVTATVTSWADVGVGTLEQATAHQLTTDLGQGMGVCNSLETKCLEKENIRGITESNGKDWILVYFSELVNLSDFTIAPDTGSKDKAQFLDVTYYTGTLSGSNDVLGKSYADLTGALGMAEETVINGKGMNNVTIDVNAVAGGEVWGNAILIGGTIGGAADRILLNGMTTVVPIPAAAWLFLSGLGVIAGMRKLGE